MMKKLLLLVSTFFFTGLEKDAKAQNGNLFNMPDSVCFGHVITFSDVVESELYSWTFCPPDLASIPVGDKVGPVMDFNSPKDFLVAKDSMYYTFELKPNGELIKREYMDGLTALPTYHHFESTIINSTGMHVVHSEMWHAFVIANGTNGFNLTRFDYPEGLNDAPEIVPLGSLAAATDSVPSIDLVQEFYLLNDVNEGWFGVTFSADDELLILDFGMDITDTPTVRNMGNIEGYFSGVSDITAVNEGGNWHVFVTNKTNHRLLRISFGNSMHNIPFVIDLGSFASRLRDPVGITIAQDCQGYYGYVLNEGSATMVSLTWIGLSIADNPTPTNLGNIAGFTLPTALSEATYDSGRVILLAANNDTAISSLSFLPCENASISTSDMRNPSVFYEKPGTYTITLTLEDGTSQCKEIVILDRPKIEISNDTLICQGDTIQLTALAHESDSFKWQPNYSIDTLLGQFIQIWPEFSTTYDVTIYYDENCILNYPIEVEVSRISADAGPDRIISDGSETIIGGPNTSRGTNYSYDWLPDIGILGSRGTPITTVEPPSNMTYYLNVYNNDGCHLIDSVLVYVPCDQVNLPNAFVPGSAYPETNKFGLKNIQFVKLNYFSIYDRWGKQVFTTNNPDEAWDGTIDGTQAPMGTYIWQVDANCTNTQQRFRQSGNVTLIR